MIRGRFTTERFENTGQQAVTVTAWRQRYDTVIAALGQAGTEVYRNRILEIDKDVPPHAFVRNARHRFVFPSQPDLKITETSNVGDEGTGYDLRHESRQAADYDTSKLEGHVEVWYRDSNGRVDIEVIDLLGSSALPADAQDALAIELEPFLTDTPAP